MTLFWRKGYHQTSMRDLTEATGLKPGSLYGAFEDKRNLFHEAMAQYTRALSRQVRQALADDLAPLARIERFFDHLVTQIATDPEDKGCLLVNTLLELHGMEPELAEHAEKGLVMVEAAFADVLSEARRVGEIAPDQDPVLLAQLLMTGIFGLRVQVRMHKSPAQLRKIVKALLTFPRLNRH